MGVRAPSYPVHLVFVRLQFFRGSQEDTAGVGRIRDERRMQVKASPAAPHRPRGRWWTPGSLQLISGDEVRAPQIGLSTDSLYNKHKVDLCWEAGLLLQKFLLMFYQKVVVSSLDALM